MPVTRTGGSHVVMVEHKTGWEPAGGGQLRDYERRRQRMTTQAVVQAGPPGWEEGPRAWRGRVRVGLRDR